MGLSSETEILKNLIILGQWEQKTEIQIEGLRKDIYTIRHRLLDFLFNKTKLEKTRSLLRRAENALMERLHNRYELLQNSAEAHALMCQQRYLISCITERENGNLFWATKKDFENYGDIKLVTELCDFFFIKSRIPTKIIRELARSYQWRIYWEIAKNTNNLFDGPILLWSHNQRELAYWSIIYDSIFNAYERPSVEIIEDDDLLDSWLIRQGEKNSKGTQIDKTIKSQKAGRSEEFIMADREGAKHVYDMNDPTTRARIKARQKILHQKGVVMEQDMPDSRNEIKQQLMTKRKQHIKNIGNK